MNFRKNLTLLTIILQLILISGCEEDTPEQICETDFTTPPSSVSKFEKWKIPSFFRGFNVGYYCSESDCYKSQEDFDALIATGANLAQINVYGEDFRDVSSPYDINQAGRERIICMASYAHNSGLYYTIAVSHGWSFSLWDWRSDKSDKHIGFNYERFDENSSNSDYWGIVLEMMN